MNDVAFDIDKVYPLEFSPDMRVNVDDDELIAHVKHSIGLGLPQAMPYDSNQHVVALVCGGPSLATTENELVQLAWKGAKVVALNGAYKWCIDRNIRPSAMAMIDARQFNSRFVQTPVDGCEYFLASQCHPDTFAACRDRKITLWHVLSNPEAEMALLDDYYCEPPGKPDRNRCHYFPVTLGTTVAIRALSLLRMLGFCRFEIFGLDSCWIGKDHHAYRQAENDKEVKLSIWTRPKDRDDLARRFICSPWMAKQADDFIQLIRERGALFQINVHGDGLIATMIKTGAEMEADAS
jgi:hypothetical protein